MATWGTEIQKAGNFIGDAFSSLTRFGGDAFNSIKRSISDIGAYFKNGGTSVVGINVNKIPDMKGAITDYIKGVNDALSELENYDPTIAFKGTSIEPALKDYIAAVKEACAAITSNLEAFSDQLTEIQKAYATKDETTASQISKSAESARSEYTTYGSGKSAA